MIPNKLPNIPKALFNTYVTVKLGNGQISEDGAEVYTVELSDKCYYSAKKYQVMNAEKQIIQLSGKMVFPYDIAPGKDITTGTAAIGGITYKVYSVQRPLNPDGTIHHTTLELM
jgi:hypothetical protein